MPPRLLDNYMPLSTDDSLINRLLLTNDPPLESEEGLVRHIITTAELKQAETDKLIDQLVRQRDKTQRIIDIHKAVLSPIRRLPPELIAEIVLYTVDPDDPCATVGLDTSAGPWMLAQIFRTWRNVVTSLPKLWSSLKFHIDPQFPGDTRNPEEIMGELLRRSSNLPLTIDYAESYKLHHEEPYPTQIMEALIGQCHRWERLDLSLASHSESLNTLAKAQGRLSILEKLHLTIETGDIELTEVTAFAVAPCLRSLFVENISGATITFPLGQLEEYGEREEALLPHPDLISQLSNVVTCDLTYTSLPTLNFGSYDPHILPRVRDLTTMSTDIFPLLTAPSLEYLEVMTFSDPLAPLAAFFRRSGCSLTSLIVDLDGEVDASVASVLTEIPSLTYLQLWDIGYDPGLVRSLNTKAVPAELALLPNLESMTMVFDETAYRDFDEQALMEMLESRLESPTSSQLDRTSSIETLFISIALHSIPRSRRAYPRLTDKICTRRDEGVRILVDYRHSKDLDSVHKEITKDTNEHCPLRDYDYSLKYM